MKFGGDKVYSTSRRCLLIGAAAFIATSILRPNVEPAEEGWFLAPRRWTEWRAEFIRCTKPGRRVSALLASFPGTQAEKLASAYVWLCRHFRYVQLETSGDVFIQVENWMALPTPVGGCVQAASFLVAAGLCCGFEMRAVATAASSAVPAHAQAQVSLPSLNDAQAMASLWGVSSIRDLPVSDRHFVLDGGIPPSAVELGRVETSIDFKP